MALAATEKTPSDSKETTTSETSIEEQNAAAESEHATKSDHVPPTQPAAMTEEETNAKSQAEEDIEYPHGPKLWLILGALCLAVFLVALDQTIISTAIPKITDHFRSVKDIGWYGSSYLLTATALQPTFGKIYTIFSVSSILVLPLELSSRPPDFVVGCVETDDR